MNKPATVPSLPHAEDLDAAIDVRQVNARAIRREGQAGEAELPVLVRLEDMIGDGFDRGLDLFLRGQRHPLKHFAGLWLKDHQVVRLARRHQQPSVGAQRQRLRPHAGQLDLQPDRREDLVGRREIAVRPNAANGVLGGSRGDDLPLRRRGLTAREQAREEKRHADQEANGGWAKVPTATEIAGRVVTPHPA